MRSSTPKSALLLQAEEEARRARAACDGYTRDFGQTPESITAREQLRAANWNLAHVRLAEQATPA